MLVAIYLPAENANALERAGVKMSCWRPTASWVGRPISCRCCPSAPDR